MRSLPLPRPKNIFKEMVSLLETSCGSFKNKKILEVDCSNGYFLAAAKEKSKRCFGSEYSKKNVENAKKNTGLPIFADPLDKFPEKNFDIIVYFDGIEHVERPLEFINTIKGLLRSGGYILLYTPNYDSFSVQTLKNYYSYVDPTEHIILFSNTS